MKLDAKVVALTLWPKTKIALVHLSFEEATVFVHRRVLWPKSFLIFIVWMNWRTLLPTSFSSWCVSHVLGFVHPLVSHVLGPQPRPTSCIFFLNPNPTLFFIGLGKTWPIRVGPSQVSVGWAEIVILNDNLSFQCTAYSMWLANWCMDPSTWLTHQLEEDVGCKVL